MDIVNCIFEHKVSDVSLESLKLQAVTYWHTRSCIDKLKDGIFYYILFKFFIYVFNYVYGYGLFRSIKDLYIYVAKQILRKLLTLPPLNRKVEKEVNETKKSLEDELIIKAKDVEFSKIPEHGLTKNDVLEKLDSLNSIKAVNWQGGKISGGVYHGGEALIDLQTESFHKFAVSNQLHPDAFPGVRQMEAEVVAMVLNLFNAPSTGCGTTSSGGTESLLLTCLAAREKGKAEKGISEPEIIAPVTIHAAVFKAAKYFNMKLKLADLDPKTFQVDINHVKRLITSNTCIILGSAPNFPYGTMDNIEKLSEIALKHKIPLHVDCCLGSFVIAYYEKAMKSKLPLFDFRLKGVTSISCDTHKYGFAPKGSSIIMYRSPDYRKYQYYVSTDWIGGLYGSPTLAGSRPGALTVGAWATMVYMGDDGYTKNCQDIILTARRLRQAIEADIPALEIIGDPKLSVVSFKSQKLNIHKLSDVLSKKGWHLSSLQNPPALHLAVTRLTGPAIENLIADLKICVEDLLKNDDNIKSDTAQLYGVANSLSTCSVVDELIESFLDVLYQNDKKMS